MLVEAILPMHQSLAKAKHFLHEIRMNIKHWYVIFSTANFDATWTSTIVSAVYLLEAAC